MAEELEITFNKIAIFKCNQCSRRFVTKIGLERHSIDEHEKEKDTQQDDLFCEIACPVCNLYFGSEIDLQLHRSNAHDEIITHRSNEFGSEPSNKSAKNILHTTCLKRGPLKTHLLCSKKINSVVMQ